MKEWKQPARVYVTYDGRAASGNTDSATVLVTADSLEGAISNREMFPGSVTYSYDNTGEYLSDERLEILADGTVLRSEQ